MAVVTGRYLTRAQAAEDYALLVEVNLGNAWGMGVIKWDIDGDICEDFTFTWYDEDRVVQFLAAVEELVGSAEAGR